MQRKNKIQTDEFQKLKFKFKFSSEARKSTTEEVLYSKFLYIYNSWILLQIRIWYEPVICITNQRTGFSLTQVATETFFRTDFR